MPNENNARLATLESLLETVIAAHLSPPPSRETLRDWFADAGIPRFKANQTAKRGGGTTYYSVPHVEKFLRSRVMPRRMAAGGAVMV